VAVSKSKAFNVRRSLLTAGVVALLASISVTVGLGLRPRSVSYTSEGSGPFPVAAELSQKIQDTAVLDPNNAALMKAFATAPTLPVVNTGLFGVPVYTASPSTPRYRIEILNDGLKKWGTSGVTGQLVPIPNGATPAAGSDGKLVIIDAADNKIFDLWEARLVGGQWQAAWGSVYPFDGDGISHNVTYGSGTNQVSWPKATSRATGSGLSSLAGLITPSEMKAGVINHALVFSSDVTCGPRDGTAFRYPATATDGLITGASCLQEGSRIRLDPTIQLSKIAGLSRAELTIGLALQKYGAYLIDSGGSRLAIVAQSPRTATDIASFNQLGMGGDYYSLAHLKLSDFQLLAHWDGN
jgi:hypothetical protein